jgi:hypothetical protein
LAAELKFSLFAVVSTLSTSCRALVSRRAGDTCARGEKWGKYVVVVSGSIYYLN